MKLTLTPKHLVITLFLVLFFFSYIVQGSDNNLPGLELTGSNECNRCHGPSHKGHVSYTATLSVPEILINDTETMISILIVNNDYPLTSSSARLQSSPEFNIVSGQASQTLGTIARGGSKSANWKIKVKVDTAKSITLQVDFQGTADDHRTNVYTKSLSKSLYVSTEPTPILKVTSSPPSGSVFYVDDKVPGWVSIANVGNLAMTDVQITTSGSIQLDGRNNMVISQLSPGESLNLSLLVDTSKPVDDKIIITSMSGIAQEVTIVLSIQTAPPTPIVVIVGRVMGYLAYTLLFLSVVTGMAKYQLRRWFSGRKLRILHADLSNLGFTMLAIHVISLALPTSPWSTSYKWFQILPSAVPTEITTVGFELGRWGLVTMYISVVSGYYFSQIVKKWGRKIGIRIHMLSYIALITGLIHAIAIGGTAGTPVAATILILTLLLTIAFKVDAIRQKRAKQAQRQQRRRRPTKTRITIEELSEEAEITRIEETLAVPVRTKAEGKSLKAVDLRTGTKRGMGVICWNCVAINDEDTSHCKNCGDWLKVKVCQDCQTRNDADAKFCKNCASINFKQPQEDAGNE